MKTLTTPMDRRAFIRKTAVGGSGLVLALSLPTLNAGVEDTGPATDSEGLEPNAFVRITPDNRVIVISKHIEMGQGSFTGLATLLAEELDANWDQVTVEGAPAHAERYQNLAWGGTFQGTGGSNAIRNSWQQLREAGAKARAMLVGAAAEAWQVPAAEITVEAGTVSHGNSGKTATFGELAERAAQQPLPEKVALKQPAQFRLIGRSLPRKDPGKTTGEAVFTQDIQFPDMLTAVIATSPKVGGVVKSFDASEARQVSGVVDVVETPSGVAVLARDFWSAQQGRKALTIEWDNSRAFTQSSADIVARYRRELDQPGTPAANRGDADAALAASENTLTADYEYPFLAHAAMEPMNCVIQKRGEGVELWYGAQLQTGDQILVSEVFGIKPEAVKINMLYAGGSFGRRANPQADYVVQAAEIAKAYAKPVPIKLVWSREDDMRGWYFRPLYVHRLSATLDDEGYPRAWRHHIVGQSIVAGTFFSGMINDGVDKTSVEGAVNLPYSIDNFAVRLHTTPADIPVQWWRSVGSTHNAYSTETFLDELASAAGKDPVAYRRKLLQAHPRHLGVLNLAAEKAGWDKPLPEGRFRGVAVHESFHSYVAQVAEIEAADDGKYHIRKITCAVDCGLPVNPDIIRAQMEGGIGYGLSPALVSEITLKDGEVEQSNFHNYQVLRINQMPAIDVHIVPSTEPPTGVGEPGTPVVAPALANALFAATGEMPRKLPFPDLIA